MEKINFQLVCDRVIQQYCSGASRPRLLLHACCAPCASYVLEYLTQFFDITLFFSNPNITSPEEYQKRLQTLHQLCCTADFCKGVAIIEDDSNPELFFTAAKGLETEPEGGKRCAACFRLRLMRTAQRAQAEGFSLFATTLTVSPHKNAALINQLAAQSASEAGIEYLPSDFKKRGGYQRSIVLSRELGLYRQSYCGCAYSLPKNLANL